MIRSFLRVTASVWVAVMFLLAGVGIAGATPGSGDNRGGGKPSPAASGKPNGNSPASANSSGKPTTKSGAQSNSASGTKTLPGAASPVAQTAVNKDGPLAPVSPTSVRPAEETPVPETPLPEKHTDDAAMPMAPTSSQSNSGHVADAPVPAARPATNLTAGALPQPGTDGTESLGAPATAALTAPGNAAPDAGDGAAAGVGKWLGDVATTIGREVRAALAEVTLKDLALAALPGIAGLLFCLVTGVGLGHRQARFSFAIQTAGATRLPPRGPLGVVGSDSFVHVNARATKPRNRALRPVDRAA